MIAESLLRNNSKYQPLFIQEKGLFFGGKWVFKDILKEEIIPLRSNNSAPKIQTVK
jgi:hypothetical protein